MHHEVSNYVPYTAKLSNGKTFTVGMQMTIHGKTFTVAHQNFKIFK